MKKYKYIWLGLVILALLIYFIKTEKQPVENVNAIDNLIENEELNTDNSINHEDTEKVIVDPYGHTSLVDAEDYLNKHRSARKVVLDGYSNIKVYKNINEILIINGNDKARLIYNTNRIKSVDLLVSHNKLAYIAEYKSNKNIIYIYDYEEDKIESIITSENENMISDLAWIDSKTLLTIVDRNLISHGIYTLNIENNELNLLINPLDNEKFMSLDSVSVDYIDIGIDVSHKEDNNRVQYVNATFINKDKTCKLWHREEDIFNKFRYVETFENYTDDTDYKVLFEEGDFKVHKLDWDNIGIDTGSEKILIRDYAQSVAVSPDKTKISMVLGEQDAWGGMYLYDLKNLSKELAVDILPSQAPKESIWIDNERLLVVYGFADGHFSIGGSLYEYNTISGMMSPIIENGEELFNIKKNNESIEISSRKFNDNYTGALIYNFEIDYDYNIIKDDSLLNTKNINLNGESKYLNNYFVIHDIDSNRNLVVSSSDGYLPPEPPASTFKILQYFNWS